MLGLLREVRLYSCKFFFVSNIIKNLICISFMHICHVLKIENLCIHSQQRNFSKNECVTS
jgi:hypothetical protein